MSDVEPQAPMSSLRLDVTLPCHARYLPMLRQLTVRAVDYLGYYEASRDEVVQAVDLATVGVFNPEGPYRDVEVRLATTETDMVVRIRYLGAATGAVGPVPIEHPLSQADGDDSPMARLQRAMTGVAMGREPGDGAVDYCELTRSLPGSDV
jgi:hypothetical protein